MTNTPLPTTRSWDDLDGRTHMVTERLRTLCGEPAPTGVRRVPGTVACDDCHRRLTALIAAAFERLDQPWAAWA